MGKKNLKDFETISFLNFAYLKKKILGKFDEILKTFQVSKNNNFLETF